MAGRTEPHCPSPGTWVPPIWPSCLPQAHALTAPVQGQGGTGWRGVGRQAEGAQPLVRALHLTTLLAWDRTGQASSQPLEEREPAWGGLVVVNGLVPLLVS